MKTFFKWISIVLGSLVGLLLLLAGGLHLIGQNRLNKAPVISVASVTVPDDEAAIRRGRHLATISSCTGCHGNNLSGTIFVDEAPIGYIPAPNLTPAGVGTAYDDEAWARAIRHGVAQDGRVITIMSSHHYAAYGDDDLGALIAYLKSVPSVSNEPETRQIQFPGTIIFGILAYGGWSVNQVDHAAVGGRNAPTDGATLEFGRYLVDIASCASCHGENLAGNPPDSDSPLGPNITPGGESASWSLEQFALALQGGQTPTGEQLSDEMPWAQYSVMSAVEVAALYEYLQSLDPLPDN